MVTLNDWYMAESAASSTKKVVYFKSCISAITLVVV